MTVRDLIEKLSEYKDDTEVIFQVWEYEHELNVDTTRVYKQTDHGTESPVINIEIT